MKALILFAILQIFYLARGEIDLQNVEIPDVDMDDFTAIKDKCDKAGGPGTYDKLKASKESFQTCLTQFVNVTNLEKEVEEAKKTGSMDEVFGKYCAKRPKLATCVQSLTTNLRLCLNSEENKALNITLDTLKQLGDFVCFRDGDRIAMFIAEGGVECIKSRTEGIQNCVNTTFKIQPTTVNTNSIPNLLIDKKKCEDLSKLQTCVVEELEKCPESTPANIVDAFFKFIKRSACTNKNKRSVSFHSVVKRSANLAQRLLNDQTDFKSNFLNVLTVIKEKCKENAPDGGYEEFTLTLESSTHCIKNKTRDISKMEENELKDTINRCVEKFVQKTERCLSEEERYWPEFYLEVVQNLIGFAYKYKDITKNITNRVELMNCFQNFRQKEAKEEMEKCFKNTEINLRKDVVCGKLKFMRNCVIAQIKERCIPDITIHEMSNDFFDAVTAPCK